MFYGPGTRHAFNCNKLYMYTYTIQQLEQLSNVLHSYVEMSLISDTTPTNNV